MNPTLDSSDFPQGFDHVKGALAYLRAHKAAKWSAYLAMTFAFVSIASVSATLSFALITLLLEREDAFPFDDESLDDEDRAAIADARAGRGSYVPLDEYFERRADRAS